MENRIKHVQQPAAYILIGIQASGKTTFFQERLACLGMEHINLDRLKTRNQERLLFDACLRAERSFAVDNTNPTRADRARYILPAKACGYRVEGFYFRSSIAESVRRNDARACAVPTKAILCTAKRLELPSQDEGFDALWYVTVEPSIGFRVERWKEDA